MIDLLGRTYQGKAVLITGHTGFKGSWLSLWLTRLGARVVGYSLEPPSRPNLFEAVDLNKAADIKDHRGDIRDYSRLLKVMTESAPEFVFHLAAQPLVRHSYQDPRTTYEINVMGTVNVLEAARQTPSVRVIVNVTTDKCYENREWVWGYREHEPLGGYDPYSSSKACSELVTAAYRQSFFSQPHTPDSALSTFIASARAGNVIGGGDWGIDRLVPDCLRALSRGEEIVLRYPQAVRPWQHVLEPLSGYLFLGARLFESGFRYAGPWNFGPLDQDVWTVEEVVREIIRLWGKGKYRVESAGNPHEASWLKLDCSKARIELGWESRYNVKKALAATVEWYRRFYDDASPKKMLDLTLSQIQDYELAGRLYSVRSGG